jgi:hypothetical protein
MKQQISSFCIYIFLLIPIHILAAEISSNTDNLEKQSYCSPVYINKDVRKSIVELNYLLPDYPWSIACKNICLDIQNEITVMPYKDVTCVIDECLNACNNLLPDSLYSIKAALENFKHILDAGKAHIYNLKNGDDEVDKMATRNIDGTREIAQLYTRNLTVDGVETVNGLLTTNGTLNINGRILLNNTDINTIIAAAAASAPSLDSVTVPGPITEDVGDTLIIGIDTPLSITHGGTNATLMATTNGTVMYDGTRLVTTDTGNTNQVLTSNGPDATPTYKNISAVTSVTGGNNINITGTVTAPIVNLTAPVTIANGGTNATTMATTNGTVYFDGTSLVTTSSTGTAGQILTSNGPGVAPTYKNISTSGAVTSVTGGTGINITGTPTAPVVNLTMPVAIAHGGTNAASIATTDGTVIYDGTRLVTTATGTANQVLTSNGPGVAPTYKNVSVSGAVTSVTGGTGMNITGTATAPIINLTTPVALTNGGTGATTLTGILIGHGTAAVTGNPVTQFNVLVGGASNTITSITPGASGLVLTSNGASANPTFQTATGINTINGDTGSITGSTVTIRAFNAAGSTNEGTVKFNNSGTTSNLTFTDDALNIGLGKGVLSSIAGGSENTGLGNAALAAVTSGTGNVGIGSNALNTLASGNNNIAIGLRALNSTGYSGSGCVVIGPNSGTAYTSNQSGNIVIGPAVYGSTDDNFVIRIGTNSLTTKTFIGAIRGVVPSAGNAVPVLVDSNNQLGTASSSKRFKENISPMPSSFSDNLLQLNPTLFNYKQDESKKQTWGLIAEEVQQIFPELVITDKEGLPFTVKYHELPVLLLNELIKLKKENFEIKRCLLMNHFPEKWSMLITH